jgi:uncharacterized SAM-dependent methyltransferase
MDGIQDEGLARHRMIDQLRARKVDSGQYYGDQLTATRWAELSQLHPTKNIDGLSLDGQGSITVVDLGPGSGWPCVATIQPFKTRVGTIVCVDTSEAMASQAAVFIQTETGIGVRCIVADFFRDAQQLRESLDGVPGSKAFLCLGGTAGNCLQRFALGALRSLLAPGDRLLIGLGLYDEDDPELELRTSANFYASEANCRFGLSFLTACGGKPDHRDAFCVYEDDPEERGVKIIRGYYRFPEDTTLHVGEEQVTFKKGDELRFLEARRYPRKATDSYLRKHGFDILASKDYGRHGLYLCQLGTVNAVIA